MESNEGSGSWNFRGEHRFHKELGWYYVWDILTKNMSSFCPYPEILSNAEFQVINGCVHFVDETCVSKLILDKVKKKITGTMGEGPWGKDLSHSPTPLLTTHLPSVTSTCKGENLCERRNPQLRMWLGFPCSSKAICLKVSFVSPALALRSWYNCGPWRPSWTWIWQWTLAVLFRPWGSVFGNMKDGRLKCSWSLTSLFQSKDGASVYEG